MLEAHEVFEEEVLYPEIDQIPQIVSMIGDAYEAHAEFDTIMRELSDSPVTDDEWMRRIGELEETVREHVRMEEESLFPAACAKLAESRAEELGRQLDARRNYL
jgi:hemerythrin superfamily protein